LDSDPEGYLFYGQANAGRGLPGGTRGACLAKRLRFLATLGLAEPVSGGQWRIRQDFDSVLKAFQESSDRQRTLAAHGVLLSDPRLPFKVTDLRDVRELFGRVLVHAEEEMTGRPYMLLEGTDASVHYILHDARVQSARHQGQLGPGSFICLRRRGGRSRLAIQDLGDAEALLSTTQKLETVARSAPTTGGTNGSGDWGGWLGRFQTAIAETQRSVADAAQRKRVDYLRNRRDRE
jgi:hypothetical protein